MSFGAAILFAAAFGFACVSSFERSQVISSGKAFMIGDTQYKCKAVKRKLWIDQ